MNEENMNYEIMNKKILSEKMYVNFVKGVMDSLMMAYSLDSNNVRYVADKEHNDRKNDRICVTFGESRAISHPVSKMQLLVSKMQLPVSKIQQPVYEMQFHVYEMYEKHENGVSFRDIMLEVYDTIQDLKKNKQELIVNSIQNMISYEKAKPYLFVRPVNVSALREEETISIIVGDIALILCFKLDDTVAGISSFRMREKSVETWGCSVDEVFDEALVNTYITNPPRLYDTYLLKEDPTYQGINFMNLLEECKPDFLRLSCCLSTPRRINGGMSIFLPGVAERLGHLMGNNDYYIAFTSKHECMLHSCDIVEGDVVRNILNATIDEATSDEDFLTRKLYKYDYSAKKILCIG